MTVNVYDFDKTIYNGDSTAHFYFYCIKKYPYLLFYLPLQAFYFIFYLLKIYNKTQFKEKFYMFLKGIKDIDREVEIFWNKNSKNIKQWYYKNKKNSDIVISASPEFLLKDICINLGVDKLIASKVDKNTGKYTGENCYGYEKVKRFEKETSNLSIKEFYSDSFSDQPLADLAEQSYIIDGEMIYNWNKYKKGIKELKG